MTRRSRALTPRSHGTSSMLTGLSAEEHADVVQLQAKLARDLGAWRLYGRLVESAREKGDKSALTALTSKRNAARQRRDHTRTKLAAVLGAPAVAAFEAALVRDGRSLDVLPRAGASMAAHAADGHVTAASIVHTEGISDPHHAGLVFAACQSIAIGRAMQDEAIVSGDPDAAKTGRYMLTEGERALDRVLTSHRASASAGPTVLEAALASARPASATQKAEPSGTGERSTIEAIATHASAGGDEEHDVEPAREIDLTADEDPPSGSTRFSVGHGGAFTDPINSQENPSDTSVTISRSRVRIAEPRREFAHLEGREPYQRGDHIRVAGAPPPEPRQPSAPATPSARPLAWDAKQRRYLHADEAPTRDATRNEAARRFEEERRTRLANANKENKS